MNRSNVSGCNVRSSRLARPESGARRSAVGLLGLLLVTGLAACDDATGPGDNLTETEAQALAQVLLTQTFAAGDPGSASLPTAAVPVARQVVDFSNEVSLELPCPLGGSVRAEVTTTGTIDSESGAADLGYSATQIHDACRVQTEESEDTFTLTGAPSITSSFQFASDGQGAFQTTGSIQGSVRWVSGDRSGTCVVALDFSGSGSTTGATSFSLSGGICSVEINQQVSVSA